MSIQAIPSYQRCIGVNATGSTISTTAFTQAVAEQQTENSNTKPLKATKAKTKIAKTIPQYSSTESVNSDMKKPENTNNQTETVTAPALATQEKVIPTIGQSAPKIRTPISKLSIVAIVLTIGLGGFIYWHGHQQAVEQKQTIEQLQAQITTLEQTLQQDKVTELTHTLNDAVANQENQLTALTTKTDAQLKQQQQAQQQFINTVNDSLSITEKNLTTLNERLAAMSKTDNNLWLISQANYLVNLAGRKIWNDQDYVTARLLLKEADASLAQANDPSLLPARQAIHNDIAALAKVSFTDFDGIILSIMGLADMVTELPLVDNYQNIDLGMTQHDDSIPDSSAVSTIPAIPAIPAISEPSVAGESTQTVDSNPSTVDKPAIDKEANTTVTSTTAINSVTTNTIPSDDNSWLSNLTSSFDVFISQFIEVEKYDDFGECVAKAGQNLQSIAECKVYKALITPEQALYLRENIRLRLFIAAQAVPRHQELIYTRALNDVAIWVNAYFDTSSSSVKSFLYELDNLQHQSIENQSVPTRLSSGIELDKLMQTRVRTMLAN